MEVEPDVPKKCCHDYKSRSPYDRDRGRSRGGDRMNRSAIRRTRDRSKSHGSNSSRPVVSDIRRSRERDISRSRDRSRSQTLQYSSRTVMASIHRSRDSSLSDDRGSSPEVVSSRHLVSGSRRCRDKSTVVQSRSDSSCSRGGYSRSSGHRSV